MFIWGSISLFGSLDLMSRYVVKSNFQPIEMFFDHLLYSLGELENLEAYFHQNKEIDCRVSQLLACTNNRFHCVLFQIRIKKLDYIRKLNKNY